MASGGGSAQDKDLDKDSTAVRAEAAKKAAAARRRRAAARAEKDRSVEASRAVERRQTREQAAVTDARARGDVQLEQGQPRPRKEAQEKASARRSKAEVTLRGRFEPRQRVMLYKVRGPEQMHAGPGDELVCVKRVRDDRSVTFTAADGVKVGERYIAVGHVAGMPRTARVTGRAPGDSAGGQAQPPVGVDVVKHGDGVIAGERGQPKLPAPPHQFLTGEGETIVVKDEI
jgi:hypothetical protein